MRRPPFTTTMNVLRLAPTRTPKAGRPSSQYVIRTFDWGSLLMLMSVRRTRGMAALAGRNWALIGDSNHGNRALQDGARCSSGLEKREVKQRSRDKVVQYAGVVQWQNISFPS